jgi:hypothetical protein
MRKKPRRNRIRRVTECTYDSVTKKKTCKKVFKRMTKNQALKAKGKIKDARATTIGAVDAVSKGVAKIKKK